MTVNGYSPKLYRCLLVASLLIGSILNSCAPEPAQEQTFSPSGTLVPTPTQEPSSTPLPTPTKTLLPTSTPIPTETPLPTSTAAPTLPPLPISSQVITSENANLLVETGRWGLGAASSALWSAGGEVLVVQTPVGLYFYGAENYDLIAYQSAVDIIAAYPSPNDEMLATTHIGGTIRTWNTRTGDLAAELLPEFVFPKYPDRWFSEEYFTSVISITFSPDSQQIAAGYGDAKVRVWQASDGSPVALLAHTIAPSPDKIAFSADGSLLASSGRSDLAIWDIPTGNLLKRIPNAGSISEAPFSPDGTLLVTHVFPGNICIWTVADASLVHRYGTGLYYAVFSFSADGEHILVNGGQQVRRLFDGKMLTPDRAAPYLPERDPQVPVDPQVLIRLGHLNGISGVEISPEGLLQVWGSYQNRIYWRTLPDGDTSSFETSGNVTNLVGLDQASVFIYCSGNSMQRYERDGQAVTQMGRCTDKTVLTASTGAGFIAWGTGTKVEFHNLSDGQLAHSLLGHNQNISSLAFSPDSTYFASGSRGAGALGIGEVHAWRVNPASALFHDEHPIGSRTLAFSPDNQYLASAGLDGKIRLWRTADGWLLSITDLYGGEAMAFSPDSKILAASGGDGTIFLWDVKNMTLIATLTGHRNPLQQLSFSPDGKSLLSVCFGGIVRMWGIP